VGPQRPTAPGQLGVLQQPYHPGSGVRLQRHTGEATLPNPLHHLSSGQGSGRQSIPTQNGQKMSCADAQHILGQLVNVTQEWLAGAEQAAEAANPGWRTWAPHRKQEHLMSLFLETDLNLSGSGSLPPNITGLHAQKLFGRHVLQVDEVVDIAKPLKDRYSQPQGYRCLKMSLTDGVQRVAALEYRPLPALSADTPAGLKVAVTDALIRRGVLLLRSENLVLLGGKVERLERARVALQQHCGRPLSAVVEAEAAGQQRGTSAEFARMSKAAWEWEETPTGAIQADASTSAAAAPDRANRSQPPEVRTRPAATQQQRLSLGTPRQPTALSGAPLPSPAGNWALDLGGAPVRPSPRPSLTLAQGPNASPRPAASPRAVPTVFPAADLDGPAAGPQAPEIVPLPAQPPRKNRPEIGASQEPCSISQIFPRLAAVAAVTALARQPAPAERGVTPAAGAVGRETVRGEGNLLAARGLPAGQASIPSSAPGRPRRTLSLSQWQPEEHGAPHQLERGTHEAAGDACPRKRLSGSSSGSTMERSSPICIDCDSEEHSPEVPEDQVALVHSPFPPPHSSTSPCPPPSPSPSPSLFSLSSPPPPSSGSPPPSLFRLFPLPFTLAL